MVATLVILGVLASVGMVKYERLSIGAVENDFYIALRELNVRESLHYFDVRIADKYVDDETLFNIIDYDLGAAKWNSGPRPARTGGQLKIQGMSKNLARAESSLKGPAQWKI